MRTAKATTKRWWPGCRGVAALILGVLVTIALGTQAVQAAPAQRGLAVHLTPGRVSTQPGGAAAYAVTVVSVNGLAGQVGLTVSGLPDGATTAFDPAAPLTLPVHGVVGTDLAIRLPTTASPGRYRVIVTATLGASTRRDRAVLRVVPSTSLTLTADPDEVTVPQGAKTAVGLTVERVGAHGAVHLGVDGLPPGTRASLVPRRLRPGQNRSRLVVRVGRNTPTGTYPLTVTARSGATTGTVTVTLHVTGGGEPFTISGDLGEELYPGATVPLNLSFTNPNRVPIQVTDVQVAIDHIDADHPGCTVDPNYAVAQFSGDYATLVVPARRTTSLDDLGVPSTAWPQVSMVETNTNQNACLGAVLTLTYTGSARRAHP